MGKSNVVMAWISPDRFDDRLDARPLNPVLLDLLDLCRHSLPASATLGDKAFVSFLSRGVGGASPTPGAVVVFKAKEVTRLGLDEAEVFVADASAIPSGKLLQPGDVLLTSSGIGTIGRAAIFPGGPDSSVDNHVCILRVRGGLDPGYLCAFLNSKFGRAWSEWGTTGSTRLLELPPTKVARFSVPLPDRRIQEYIGKRVWIAAECRARALKGLNEARNRFDTVTGRTRFSPPLDNTNTIAPGALSTRLSAEYYLPRYFDLERHLRSLPVGVRQIGELVRSPILRTTTPERIDDGSVPCIITSDIDPYLISWRTPSLRISRQVAEAHPGRLEALDVVYTSVGPPVGEAAVVLREHLPISVGGDVTVLRAGDELQPGYLCMFLNSVFGQMQNDRYSRGIRQRRVYPDDIAEFVIPTARRDDQTFIGERVLAYEHLLDRALVLALEAEAEVEGLIEGRIDANGILAGKLLSPTLEDVLRP